jgi:GT2 family glycosyltransferase
MSDADAIDVLVVVVTYNSSDLIADLVASLPAGLAGLSWQLVVADNDSRDDTVEVLSRHAPDAVVVEMGRNAGYSAGINAAVAAGKRSDSVLILNPDSRLHEKSAAAMRRRLQDDRVGIVAPRLLDIHGGLVLTLRREPGIRRALGDAVMGAMRAGRYATWGEMVVDTDAYATESTADWVAAPALLVSRDCIDTCGPWDESFFLYSEETEFCLRARNLGYRLVLAPDALVSHLGGESQTSRQLYTLVVVNRIRLYQRSHGAAASAAFWFITALRELTRSARPISRHAFVTLLSREGMRSAADRASGQLPDRERRSALARASKAGSHGGG